MHGECKIKISLGISQKLSTSCDFVSLMNGRRREGEEAGKKEEKSSECLFLITNFLYDAAVLL